MACEKLRERICGEWAALLERSWVLKKIAQPRHHLDTSLLKLSKADTQPCSGDNSHAGNLHGPRRRQASGVHLETLAPNQHGPQDWRQRPCKGAHWHTVATLPTDRTGSILPAFILQAPHVSNPPSRHLFQNDGCLGPPLRYNVHKLAMVSLASFLSAARSQASKLAAHWTDGLESPEHADNAKAWTAKGCRELLGDSCVKITAQFSDNLCTAY